MISKVPAALGDSVVSQCCGVSLIAVVFVAWVFL